MASVTPQPRGRGKPRRRSKLNRGLFLRGGVWWLRVERNGRDVRESLHVPASEEATARAIRDKRLAAIAEEGAGIDRPRDPLLLGELIRAYVREESQPFDRSGPIEQSGTKRSAESDRGCIVRLFGREAARNKNGKVIARARRAHLDPNLSAAKFDRESLLELAGKIEKEKPVPAPSTRRKCHAFFRRVFSWATERPRATGITRNPYSSLTREQRKRLFPPIPRREFVYPPEMLRAIYGLLPPHALPFVRFAAHTGMRLNEITSLTWSAVDLDAGTVTVLPQFAKSKRQRDVPLGKVAGEILARLRPANSAQSDAVFLGRRGGPIRSVREAFDQAVLAVWKPSKPGERKPTFHDLRATVGTRVEAVSSYAAVKLLLGHSTSGDVTSGYIRPSLDSVREALNRAAVGIDGEAPEGAIPFRARVRQAPEMARLTASPPDSDAASAR